MSPRLPHLPPEVGVIPNTRQLERAERSASEPTLDQLAFDELRDFGDEFLVDLVSQFTTETDPLVRALREAFALVDSPTVARLCHAIKGGSSQLGARRLRAYCNQLERRANNGYLPHGEDDLENVELEYEELRRSLTRQLELA